MCYGLYIYVWSCLGLRCGISCIYNLMVYIITPMAPKFCRFYGSYWVGFPVLCSHAGWEKWISFAVWLYQSLFIVCAFCPAPVVSLRHLFSSPDTLAYRYSCSLGHMRRSVSFALNYGHQQQILYRNLEQHRGQISHAAMRQEVMPEPLDLRFILMHYADAYWIQQKHSEHDQDLIRICWWIQIT